jgi:hypothetical protein
MNADFKELENLDPQDSAREAVIRQVSSWKGISLHEHRFGGVEFRLGRHELGHLHPKFADLPLPRQIRDEVVASGRAKPHHVVPDSGWVTVPMRTAPEAENVIGLLRLNYERAANAVDERKPGEDLSNTEKDKNDER